MVKRSYEHVKAQREGRSRDNNTCQVCGSTNSVEGHHVIDYQFSGAASADNIISLCHDCHTKVHTGKMDVCKF